MIVKSELVAAPSGVRLGISVACINMSCVFGATRLVLKKGMDNKTYLWLSTDLW